MRRSSRLDFSNARSLAEELAPGAVWHFEVSLALLEQHGVSSFCATAIEWEYFDPAFVVDENGDHGHRLVDADSK